MKTFKLPWPNWGPKKYRENNEAITDAINQRTPIKGVGIDISENPDGAQISARAIPPTDQSLAGATGGGASGGTSVDVYGAFNGAPALFHLLQSSAPTVPPP